MDELGLLLFKSEGHGTGDLGKRWCCGASLRVLELEPRGGVCTAADVLGFWSWRPVKKPGWYSSLGLVELETCGEAGLVF